MKTIKEIFKIGHGPSSSHTMGPAKAAEILLSHIPETRKAVVTLYGSLAATGKGHLTDKAIEEILGKAGVSVEFNWQPRIFLPFHPNGMKFEAYDAEGRKLDDWTVYSVGGGSLKEEKQKFLDKENPDIYEFTTMTDIMRHCQKYGINYWEYVQASEGPDLWDYLSEAWNMMKESIQRGLSAEEVLPGPIHLKRKAATFYIKSKGLKPSLESQGLTFAYALAVSEENAAGHVIVTAPTCGSCGVLPAVLYHLQNIRGFMDIRILRAMATAGLFGNVVKENASISGAEVGCQGEVGVACAMASAAANQLFGGSPSQIEYAAEMGLEHHLGMTCDPVCGMVQIPCIERNAYAALRALDSNLYSSFTDGHHTVSFDRVVEVMKQTGHDLPSLYKETSLGGLAKSVDSDEQI
jgi:L-serine dehydratase